MKSFFFIKLFAIVIFTASFIPIFGGAFINKGLTGIYQEEIDHYQGGTTIALLVQAMRFKNTQQRAVFLKEQQALMPFNLKLESIDNLDLPNHKMLQLYQNQLVYNGDNQFLYMILAGHEEVLVLENVNIRSDHIYSDVEREGMGLMALLQRQLERTKRSEWKAMIAQKASLFSFDIALKPLGSFPLNQAQQHKLDKGKLVAISQDSIVRYGSGLNYLLQLTPDSKQVLIAGPIAPEISSLINQYYLLNTAYLAMMLLCLLSFWIWPTWRSSRELLVFIHQHAQEGKAKKLTVRFGSHLNGLHNTFNQMSDNITRQFFLNKMVIQYLSQRLEAPLIQMEKGLDKAEASRDTRMTSHEVHQQEEAINDIRQLSSDILLFSLVQGVNRLVNKSRFNLEDWLFLQQEKLCEAAPKLNLIRVNQRREVSLDSKLMVQGLSHMLAVISNNKLDALNLFVAQDQALTRLILECISDDDGLLEELELLCEMNQQPMSKSATMITSELYLPLFCCARIFKLHAGCLRLNKCQTGVLTLEICFSNATQVSKEIRV
ncbi:two component sensor kinase [Marinomonas sp. MED121]|uniref:two component sensor kinase n=1 Tax=Marinomonas sp. MED121 TaxID=314277 RepID=UPI000068FE34|nr:two component sensor kinase [Marinomonas sp. MED121]EAQ63411.1 two component sensor kinase [Marinomonas sp. MED121]